VALWLPARRESLQLGEAGGCGLCERRGKCVSLSKILMAEINANPHYSSKATDIIQIQLRITSIRANLCEPVSNYEWFCWYLSIK
jgi:hypothetical protein